MKYSLEHLEIHDNTILVNVLKWLFIDFDSYFASVEQHLHPCLRGKPIGVVPTMAETTSCIAASYEAKAYGVRTGTRVSEARLLCPGIQFIEAEHKVYVEYHQSFHRAIEEHIPITQTLSIDEVSCLLPTNWREPFYVENLMLSIKESMKVRVSPWITCSMGAAPNKFLAKLASKYHKPDGHCIVLQKEIPGFLREHKLSDLNGIGRRMEERLRKAGVYSVAQLSQCSEETLRGIWGSVHGSRMWRALRGEDLEDLPTHTSSIGHSHVLAPEKRVPYKAETVLHRLLQKALLRLRAKEYVTTDVQVSLRYDNGARWGAEARFDETSQNSILADAVDRMWKGRPEQQEPIRKISVTFTRLREYRNYTLSLFSQPDRKREAADKAMDSIVTKYGKQAAYYGNAHGAISTAPMRIAFNHIPNTVLEE